VPYFLAESEATDGKEAAGARGRNAVEDLNGGTDAQLGPEAV
jgi:hypothetical protein